MGVHVGWAGEVRSELDRLDGSGINTLDACEYDEVIAQPTRILPVPQTTSPAKGDPEHSRQPRPSKFLARSSTGEECHPNARESIWEAPK
jgi:hypothetical protein